MGIDAFLISDLHLQQAEQPLLRILQQFLAGPARQARQLFILGDLFEAWIGDDDDAEVGRRVAESLAELSAHGCRIALMHGNRDFLLGRSYADRCGAELLPDPCVVELGGVTTLLSHGDVWCIDDQAYQQVRRQLRAPRWQADFLSRPLAERRAFATQARQQSAAHQRELSMELMDVNVAALESDLQLYGCSRLIHGHTHRPARHSHPQSGGAVERWVLADWRESGEALAIHDHGQVERLPLSLD